MAKSAKVFVFISLIYGALMFLIISFFHAGDVIQEDQNLNPTSKFLSVSETQGKSQVSTKTDQTETESITPVADEVEKQPEVETSAEGTETATSETTTVPEETAEEIESTPKESVEETESVPDETVESENNTVAPEGTTENSTTASNETTAETESIPNETIENAEVTPSETVEETNSVPNGTIENVEADETVESTETAPTETVEETKSVPEETVKETEAASTETAEKTETVPSETVEETKSAPNKTVQNKKKGQGKGQGKGKNVSAAPKKTTPVQKKQKKAVEETKAAPIENKKAVPATPKKTTPVQKKQKKAVEEAKVTPIESTKAAPAAPKKAAKNKTPAQKKQNNTVEETKTAPIESTKTVPEGTIEDSTIANNTIVENTTVATEGAIAATEANTTVTKAFNYTALPFKYNPFHLMGAYPDPTPYIPAVDYDKPHFGLINNDNYCNQVDLYNLHNPENMFEVMNFYTDFPKRSLMKRRVMRKLGKVFNTKVTRKMGPRTQRTRSFQYDTNITTFHITGDSYYQYHKIGQHFACATQMFSHIPNHTLLLQKDHFPLAYKNYQLKYQDKPQCLENSVSYPKTFRLFDKDECEEFFEVLHTRKYRHSLEEDPVQYLLKIGHDAHKAEGVFLVDDYYTDILNKGWEHGYECGNIDAYLIVQRYITNPMLLDNNNKFHMRVYLLIASTNPLIVFYHDGYLRASIYPFQKGSNNRAAHLTNLLMGNKFADEVQSNLANATNGMTAKELEDYYLWSFEELADYLYESGKTKDPNWLNNYLRPALQRAFVHVVRMSSAHFWKQSNVYEMFGCDFMMDDQTNLWFIEANANPLLDIQKEMMTQMLKDLFEINYAYYRSRMKRILEALESIPQDPNEAGDGLKMKVIRWRRAFKKAAKNRLEPEFQLSANNTWVKIMDKNLKGAEAYYGHISEECL